MVLHSLLLSNSKSIQIILFGLVLLLNHVQLGAQEIANQQEPDQEVPSTQAAVEDEARLRLDENSASDNDAEAISTGIDIEQTRALERKRNQLEHQISQLEIEFGPYFQELTEPMLELADVYRDLGDHESSLELLDRSLHMVRINSGLESVEQMPVLLLYANALAEGGEHEKAEAKQFQYFQVARRELDPKSEEFMQIMFDLRKQHANNFISARGDGSIRDLLGAYSLSLNLSDALEEKYSVESIVEEDVVVRTMTVNPEYQENLLWLMSLDFLMYTYGFHERDPILRNYSPALVSRIEAQRSGAYGGEAAFYNDPETNYRRGRQRADALVEMTAKIEGWGSLEHVLAQVLLGDWYYLFGRHNRAQSSYAFAMELAITPEVREPLERIFSTPSVLPISTLSVDSFYSKAINRLGEEDFEFQGEEVQRGFIRFSYNLSVSGRKSEVELIETNLRDPERAMQREMRRMRSRRTRPVFSETGFVATDGLVETIYFGRAELDVELDLGEDETVAAIEGGSIDDQDSLETSPVVDDDTGTDEVDKQVQTAIQPSSATPLRVRGGSEGEMQGDAR